MLARDRKERKPGFGWDLPGFAWLARRVLVEDEAPPPGRSGSDKQRRTDPGEPPAEGRVAGTDRGTEKQGLVLR